LVCSLHLLLVLAAVDRDALTTVAIRGRLLRAGVRLLVGMRDGEGREGGRREGRLVVELLREEGDARRVGVVLQEAGGV
jgi:hypothetical protein